MGDRLHQLAAVGIAVVAVIVVLAWFGRRAHQVLESEDTARSAVVPATKRAEPAAVGEAALPAAPSEADPAPADEAAPADEEADSGEMDDDQMAAAWAAVDFAAVRAALPDNLYFKLSSPTKDEAVLAERDAERQRWNEQYGKILSGTATEEEIRTYYDERARLSTDYLEFATYLLDHYRDTLPPRDVALLDLSRQMHNTRLEEIPRKVEEAFERKRQQDEARAAWLAGEAEFRGDASN